MPEVTCDVSRCPHNQEWELTFPDHKRPWRFCTRHAAPHLMDTQVGRRRLG